MFGMLSWNQKPLWADSCHICLFGQMQERSSAVFTRELAAIWGCARLCDDLVGLPHTHTVLLGAGDQQTWTWASSLRTCVCLLYLGLV